MDTLAREGLDYLPELVRILLNPAMRAEREGYLQARPYKRTADRRGHANDYKPKTVKTRLGEITFAIPQVREGGFYPQALEKGLRSERALMLALAEMYVQGVSTRKVQAILERLGGTTVSSIQVSRAAAQLDAGLQAWRERPLGDVFYLYLDARYETVRQGGTLRDVAVLIAVEVLPSGKRTVLGVSVSLNEKEIHWRDLLQSLVQRGLRGVQLIWKRCQFHLQQNAAAYIPRKALLPQLHAELRAVFQALDRVTAVAYLKQMVARYVDEAPQLAQWLEHQVPEGLTVFAFPTRQRRKLRTVNLVERLNREVRRWTRVVGIFPSEASCLRLVCAVLMEIDEAWSIGRTHMRMEETSS